MAELEEKLGAILSNPALMSQIQTMANSMSQSQAQSQSQSQAQPQAQSKAQPKQERPQNLPAVDPNQLEWLSKLTGLARQSGIDSQEQALLKALRPYLSQGRLGKLERAMRAAKIAGIATKALNHN